jgi:endonuclease/exonuclease/phosphatase family metal-dependent hydrolase
VPAEDGIGQSDGGIAGLVKAKPLVERIRLSERIRQLNADVLLVQEVEHRDALKQFNATPIARGGLGGLYKTAVCIDGNDPRRIDVGVLSRVPLGAITSWQHVIHPSLPDRPVFSRDLLEIDVLSSNYAEVRLTCFATHLKSNLIPWKPNQTEADRQAIAQANDDLRALQADMIARILERRALEVPHLLCGDMNDSPDSDPLRFLRQAPTGLHDALTAPIESPPYALPEEVPPANVRWTHRYRADDTTTYELFDQIWVDTRAQMLMTQAGIARRARKTKDGTDHDAAWVDLDIDLAP